MTTAVITSESGIIDLARLACQNNPDDAGLALAGLERPKQLSWIFEAGLSAAMGEFGGPNYPTDADSAYDLALLVGRIVKAHNADAELTCDQFEFWSTPWGFTCQQAPIMALHRAISFLESDEFTLDETDAFVCQKLQELLSLAMTDGATWDDIQADAETLFRSNAKLATALKFDASGFYVAEEIEA